MSFSSSECWTYAASRTASSDSSAACLRTARFTIGSQSSAPTIKVTTVAVIDTNELGIGKFAGQRERGTRVADESQNDMRVLVVVNRIGGGRHA